MTDEQRESSYPEQQREASCSPSRANALQLQPVPLSSPASSTHVLELHLNTRNHSAAGYSFALLQQPASRAAP